MLFVFYILEKREKPLGIILFIQISLIIMAKPFVGGNATLLCSRWLSHDRIKNSFSVWREGVLKHAD